MSISDTYRERTISYTGCGLSSDFFMNLGRLLLVAAVFNSVDDFHGVEMDSTAWSAFGAFERLNNIGGSQKKKEKKSPVNEPRMLGSQFDV